MTWLPRLVLLGVGAALAVSTVAIWIGATRGLDLTDEGIYLVTYRAFRHPELTFTGTPAILGPVFQLLGWSIPALRRAKLIAILLSSGALGAVVDRFLSRRIDLGDATHIVRRAAVILLTMIGGLTAYAFLPQSPSYNDMAIILSMLAVAITLSALDAGPGVRISIGAGIGLGFVLMLLFLVKFPSALMIGAGCLLVLVLRRRTTIPTLLRGLAPGGLIGGVLALAVLQLLAGDIAGRIRALFRANDTAVKSQKLSDSYLRVYTSAASSIIRDVLPYLLVLVAVAVLGRLASRGRRGPLTALMIVAAAGLLLVARRKLIFTGGQDHIATLQDAFPLLTAITFVLAVALGRSPRQAFNDNREAGLDLGATTALLLAAPVLQGIGTGNSPFLIAASAGALWVGGLLSVVLWFMPLRGVGAIGAIGTSAVLTAGVWLLGAPALWLTPFRLTGDLRDQTAAVHGVPRLAGLRTDAATAAFIEQAHAVVAAKHLQGQPGFSSFAGVGLAYALELRHPPAGIYIDEPLGEVLKARVADACRLGAIGPAKRPVVLSDGSHFEATAGALQLCGIDFPGDYDRVDLVPPPFLKSFGFDTIAVWTPKN